MAIITTDYGLTKPLPGCQLDYGHPINRGLVGCWLFNEMNGTRLTDYSGYGNHGTLSGFNMTGTSNWVGTPMGGGLEFAPKATASNYVYSSLKSTQLMTVYMRVKIGTLSASDNVGVLYWDGSTTVDSRISFCVTGTTANQIFIAKSNVAYFKANTSYTSLADNKFHDLVFVCDKSSAANSKIYVDTREITYTNSANQTFTADTGFNINHWVVGADSRFSPSVYDYLKIWDRLLTQSEISQLYYQPNIGFQSQPYYTAS